MTTAARLERERLCDLLRDVGPDAPTLCGDWTTRDLAAHLVVRERRPDGAIGIVAKPLSGWAEKVRLGEAARDYETMVGRVRSGPPLFSPMRVAAVDRMVNTIEFFVHHEDVRRAGDDWDTRQLDDELERDLDSAFERGVRLLARKAPTGVTVAPDGYDTIVAKRGDPTVTVSGPLGEVVLFMYGRQDTSRVELDGPDDAVESLRSASLGI